MSEYVLKRRISKPIDVNNIYIHKIYNSSAKSQTYENQIAADMLQTQIIWHKLLELDSYDLGEPNDISWWEIEIALKQLIQRLA